MHLGDEYNFLRVVKFSVITFVIHFTVNLTVYNCCIFSIIAFYYYFFEMMTERFLNI